MTGLSVEQVTKEFPTRREPLVVLRGVSFELSSGANLADVLRKITFINNGSFVGLQLERVMYLDQKTIFTSQISIKKKSTTVSCEGR